MPRPPALPLGVFLICVARALAAPPATAPTDDSPAKVFAENAKQKADLAREWATIPHHPAKPAGRLVGFDLEDGLVRVRPLETDDATPFAVDAVGWPGFLQLDTTHGADVFVLKHTAFSADGLTETITHVETTPGRLQFGRDSESPAGVRNVTLIQARQNGDEDQPVRLFVQADAPAGQKTEFRLAAATFTELCRQNPDVVRDYLLPILTDLGAAKIARVSDPATAWQVLGDRVPVDPALAAKLDDLVKALDADAFATRAKAEDDLAALGPAAAAALRRRDLARLPPDPRSSIETAVRRNEPLPPEQARTLGRSLPFLLETLLLDEPTLVTAAGVRLGELTGRPPPDVSPTLPMNERERRVEAYRGLVTPTTAPAR